MVTNIGFDNGAPYVEEGADEGRVVQVGGRLAVEPIPTATTVFTLERSIDGQTWESVLGDTPSPDGVTLIDWESLSYGDTLYRAVAETVEGATAETVITVQARSGALWLSGGVGYGETCRLVSNVEQQITGGRRRTLKEFAGRSKPVAYTGEALQRKVAVSGTVTDRTTLEPSATPDDLMELTQNDADLFMVRDVDGRRIYGSVPGVDLTRKGTTSHVDELRPWGGIWGFRFELTEAEV